MIVPAVHADGEVTVMPVPSDWMSKTRDLPEVLVKNDECRQIQPVGSMIQPLANCGLCPYRCAPFVV